MPSLLGLLLIASNDKEDLLTEVNCSKLYFLMTDVCRIFFLVVLGLGEPNNFGFRIVIDSWKYGVRFFCFGIRVNLPSPYN